MDVGGQRLPGRTGLLFAVHGSVSLETQRLPDAPNHPGFGACVLRPDDEYRSTTVLTFGVGEPPECSDLSGPVVT